MKISKFDFEELEGMIHAMMASKDLTFGKIRQLYGEKSLSGKRMRWDIIWALPIEKRTEWFDRVYQYADDTHVDTALNAIVGK